MKEFFKVLKDHSNQFMQELVNSSYQHCFMSVVDDFLEDSASSVDTDECGTENVVRVCVVDSSFQSVLSAALNNIQDAKLKFDRFGFDVATPGTTSEQNPEEGEPSLGDKLTVLINDITIVMKRLEYALFRGNVYKKCENAKYTYSYKCDVAAFINGLAANECFKAANECFKAANECFKAANECFKAANECFKAANECFKARVLKNMKKAIDILGDPNCEVIRPIKVDYNLIEVNGGHCWSIAERCFHSRHRKRTLELTDMLNGGKSLERASEANQSEDSSCSQHSVDSDDDQIITDLRRALGQSSPRSFRYRQIDHFLKSRLEEKARMRKMEEKRYEGRQQHFMSRGVRKEHVALLPKDNTEPLPTPIRKDLKTFNERVVREELESRKTKSERYISSPVAAQDRKRSSRLRGRS